MPDQEGEEALQELVQVLQQEVQGPELVPGPARQTQTVPELVPEPALRWL